MFAGVVVSVEDDVASRIILSATIPSSYMIWSLIPPTSYFWVPILLCIVWSNIVAKVEPSIGENLSSPIKLWTPAPVFVTATDIALAIETLPNGLNPAGWTDFCNSFFYWEKAAPTLTS